MKSEIFFLIALVFDFVAFVPQGVIGYIIDELKTKHITLIGILLMSLSLVLLFLKVEPIINIIILSIGNAMIHIDGAEKTLRSSPGKMSPAAIFVSGGSFGLIIGKILASIKTPVILIIIIDLLAIIPLVISNKYKNQIKNKNLNKYNYSNKKINRNIVIILATTVVIVRAYMGYAIPTSWNKTIIQSILIYFTMGTFKAIG